MDCMNCAIGLADDGTEEVHTSTVWHAAVPRCSLCLHNRELSIGNSILVLKRHMVVVPLIDRLQWKSEDFIAYLITGRDQDECDTWMPQRDYTPNLSEFEREAFKGTSNVLLHVLHIFLARNDELFGTWAADHQLKILSVQKADGKGHSNDAIADAISRIVFQTVLRRHGQSQLESVKRLLMEFFHGKS